MSRLLRRALGHTRLYPAWKALAHYPDYLWWLVRGRPQRTPHLVKQRAVLEYAWRFRLATLVETGTYYGEMIAATRRGFRRIYSIESDAGLAALARRRFRRFPQVEVLHGDSQFLLPYLLTRLGEACLFWLDAGYYGWEEQVGKMDRLSVELRAILGHPYPHVILLDDAHGVDGRGGAPTLAELIAALARDFPGRSFEVTHDILRICPATSLR
ncbi:MAG TPA: hypothetical protein VLT85_06505 [Terriglobales bacterium]|nr:hypothetical protein [Terriglobales bacterium]